VSEQRTTSKLAGRIGQCEQIVLFDVDFRPRGALLARNPQDFGIPVHSRDLDADTSPARPGTMVLGISAPPVAKSSIVRELIGSFEKLVQVTQRRCDDRRGSD
jgi:hypothetical protein